MGKCEFGGYFRGYKVVWGGGHNLEREIVLGSLRFLSKCGSPCA